MAFLRDRSIGCIPNTTLSHNQRLVISGLCIPTSTVGFIGAALQLKNLWQYRNRQRRRPSADPRIIFYLALADLFTCLGKPAYADSISITITEYYIIDVYSLNIIFSKA